MDSWAMVWGMHNWGATDDSASVIHRLWFSIRDSAFANLRSPTRSIWFDQSGQLCWINQA